MNSRVNVIKANIKCFIYKKLYQLTVIKFQKLFKKFEEKKKTTPVFNWYHCHPKFPNILQGEGSASVTHLCQISKMEEEIISGILKQILHLGEL